MKKVILLAITLSLCNCTALVSTPSGLREWYRGQNGLITQGKSKPNTPTGYWQNELSVTRNWGNSYSYTQNDEDQGS